MATARMVLRSVNEHDMSSDDLLSLAADLKGLTVNAPLEISTEVAPSFGSGNGWYDSLLVWLPTAELVREQIYGPIFETIVDFMRKRFTRKGEEERPRSISFLYGPDNEILAMVEIPDDKSTVDRPDLG